MAYITPTDLIGLGYDLNTSLGTVTAPGVSASGTSGAITSATYRIRVAALTIEAAQSVMLDVQETGLAFDPTLGCTLPSAYTSVSVTAGQKMTITINPVNGAGAYAIFVGAPPLVETLQIVTNNVMTPTTFSLLVSGGMPQTTITEDTSGDSVALNNICQWASDMADRWCYQHLGQILGDVEVKEVRIRYGMIKFFPTNYRLPIANITSLQIQSYDRTFTTNATNLMFIQSGQYILGNLPNLPSGIYADNYLATLTYDHGFAQADTSADWRNIRTAVIQIAQPMLDDFFFAKFAEIANVTTLKQGNISYTRDNLKDIPQNAKNILNYYKRIR